MKRHITKDIELISLYFYRNIRVSYFLEDGFYLGVYTVACNPNRNTGVRHENLQACKREIFTEASKLVEACLRGGALVKTDIGDFYKFLNEATNSGQQALLF